MDILRCGRKARRVKLLLRSLTLEIQAPAGSGTHCGSLTVNAVQVEEIDAPTQVEPLCWVLLTTEPVACAEDARRVAHYYELRWRIGGYHKAWKSGVSVERQRYQSSVNLARMLAITAFLAVRLLQLRESHDGAERGRVEGAMGINRAYCTFRLGHHLAWLVSFAGAA